VNLMDDGATAVVTAVPPRIRAVPSHWQGSVMVCRKCSKKLDGGFGTKGKQSLAKVLRKAKHSKKGRQGSFGVVEIGCVGLCPGGGVTVIDGARPGQWLVVKRGADVEDLAAVLG
jgi:predicted metal-binding protein